MLTTEQARPQGLNDRQQQFLRRNFPAEQCLLRDEARIYSTDAGRFQALPWAVVRPRQLEQVQELLNWAQKERVPLFPRGRGTNVVGGCVPSGGGVVVSTLFMDSILQVEEEDFTAVVQPGVVTRKLQERAEESGLLYPPDPASVQICSLGGNAATNAGGMRAVKYGVTGDYILGCQAVLPGGKAIRSGGRMHKDVVGLDLTSLLVGSEGTLAFLTELTLKLLPLPEGSASVLAGFPDQQEGLEAARNVFSAGLLPASLEFMDREAVACLRSYGYDWLEETDILLLFKVDGTLECVEHECRDILRLLSQRRPSILSSAGTPAEEDELWEARRALNPASFNLGPNKLSLDLSVPRGSLGKAVESAQLAGREHGIWVLTFGHAGDGNMHVNFVYDACRGQEEQAMEAASDMICRVLDLQGTISGEHGVGLAKLPYVKRQLGEEQLGLMQGIKQVFDPCGILNPGKGY